MSFGANVGINFRESMSGVLVKGVDDPDRAQTLANGSAKNFSFSVLVSIASLRKFLDAPNHVAELTAGKVRFDGVCADNTPIIGGGTIQLYRNKTPNGREKDFVFLFGFKGDDGRFYSFSGEKKLRDDPGIDIFRDLSEVYGKVQVEGKTIAAGVVRVHLDELLDQIISMSVVNAAHAGESVAAQGAFLSFMNENLQQIYPTIPPLFHTDERRFLTPTEWWALTAIAQAMLPEELPANGPTIEDTVLNIQSFIRNINNDALDEIRSLLRLLGIPALLAPVSIVRKLIQAHLDDPKPGFLDALDRLKAVSCVPYYAHPKADAVVRYQRPVFEPKFKTRLEVESRPPPGKKFDVVIAGSGVAGAILADRATANGRSVLLLEAGRYQPEHEFSTDELRMTARLYKGAGLQATEDQVTVLQPWCVGGGGVVNNAICFQLPKTRFERWSAAGFPIEESVLRAAYKSVAKELEMQPVSDAAKNFNPASQFLRSLGEAQIPSIDQPPPQGLSECLVNLKDCQSLGLCNSGCGSERKKNSFQVHLKRALATGRCTLVADARAVDLRLDATNAVRALVVEINGEKLEVVGKEYVLAAGAIGSSVMLLGSEVHKKLPHLPIGKRFTANLGCPTFVFSKRVLHQRPSVQISHAYLPPGDDGFVVESWFGPPGTIAIAMPGYLQTHAERMSKYANITAIAPLVGAEPFGTIELDGPRPKVRIPPNPKDLERLKKGSAFIAQTILDSRSDALDMILLGTRTGFEIRSKQDIAAFLGAVQHRWQLRLGSGHPQGGNAMSEDAALSVVDGNFRVRGVANLRVCDASVFPDGAGVNPQWTVMALAHLCGASL